MKCSFCEKAIQKGTGTIYVYKDGTTHFFCSKKCEKNSTKLKRINTRVKWTNPYHKAKKARLETKAKKA